MPRTKIVHINSIKTPLWFGKHRGKSLEDIIQIDKLYVVSLLKDLTISFEPRVVNRLLDLFKTYDIPAMSKYKRIPSFTIRDLVGKRIGYFVLDPQDIVNTEYINEKNMSMQLTIEDGKATAIINKD